MTDELTVAQAAVGVLAAFDSHSEPVVARAVAEAAISLFCTVIGLAQEELLDGDVVVLRAGQGVIYVDDSYDGGPYATGLLVRAHLVGSEADA